MVVVEVDSIVCVLTESTVLTVLRLRGSFFIVLVLT